LVKGIGDSDGHVSHAWIIVSLKSNVEETILPSTDGTFTREGRVSEVGKVVALEGSRVKSFSRLSRHLDGEVLSIPGIDCPDFTVEVQAVNTGVHIGLSEYSPEGMALSTLIVSTIISVSLAGFDRGSTVILPKFAWVSDTFVNVSSSRLWSSIIKLIVQSHVTITDGFISSTLLKSISNGNGYITFTSIIRSRKFYMEPSILPATDRSFTLKSLISIVIEIITSKGFRVHNITILVCHSNSELFSIP
jgi:hypothetical protein